MRPSVVDGEASETDDELVDDVDEVLEYLQTMPNRPRVHLDEKLSQRWRHLGADCLTISWRRVMAPAKVLADTEKLLESTFNSVKVSGALMRSTSSSLTRLEESFEAIVSAAALIPNHFDSRLNIPKV